MREVQIQFEQGQLLPLDKNFDKFHRKLKPMLDVKYQLDYNESKKARQQQIEDHIKKTLAPTIVKKQGIEDRLLKSIERKEKSLKELQDKKESTELDGCTFQPNKEKL